MELAGFGKSLAKPEEGNAKQRGVQRCFGN